MVWLSKGRGECCIRLPSNDVAKKILHIEDRKRLLGIGSFDRVADPSIFAEKDGPSVAEKFALEGVVWRKGENRRISGWDQVRGLLRGRCIERITESIVLPNGSEGERIVSEKWEPMLYVTENCTEMIRTLPIQERDETDYEDVETTGEDHAVDELRYVAMSRPSVSKTINELLRPRQLTENERDFAMATSIISDGVEYDGLSYPITVDMGIQDVGIGGMNIFIAK